MHEIRNSAEPSATAQSDTANLLGPANTVGSALHVVRLKRKLAQESAGTALYLFAGPKRRSTIGSILRKRGWEVHEVDILQDPRRFDLSKQSVQKQILDKIKTRTYSLVLASPPCDTFSRVKFSNHWGPRPTRTAAYPRGLPNATQLEKHRNRIGNTLTDFTFACLLEQAKEPEAAIILEFPEDLGAIPTGSWQGVRPASIFQWKEFEELLKFPGVVTGGIRQSDFGTPYVKPTRLILKFQGEWELEHLFRGTPQYDEAGYYLGPIPPTRGQVTLAKRSREEPFRTTHTAAWPMPLCRALADLATTTHLARKRVRTDSYDDDRQPVKATTKGTVAADSPYPIVTPPEGFWVGGHGPPRTTSTLGKLSDFHDGCGLTSPGRWTRENRRYPEGKRWDELRAALLATLTKDLDETGVLKQVAALACGRDIYNHRWPEEMRMILHSWLARQTGGYSSLQPPVVAPGQPFYLKLIFGLLCEVRDADCMLFKNLDQGTTIGVLEPLPHTPAIYELQTKWRLPEDPFITAKFEKPNYCSVEKFIDVVEQQFQEEAQLGWMEKFSDKDFVEKFGPNRAVSALAVLEEKDKVRVLHDATHDTCINHRIKCRDRQRMPTVKEKHCLLEEQRKAGQIAFGLPGDVSKAHRRILVKREEHGLLGCRLRPGETWVNRVGTFGVASASYWWGRVAGAIFRLTYALLGGDNTLDLLVFADDAEFIAVNRRERLSILLAISLLIALGMPFKWAKFRGGFEYGWIGFAVSYKLYAVGLTEERAKWIADWTGKLIEQGVVATAEMRGGVGRLNYAAQALIYEKAFLGMIYLWVCAAVASGQKQVTIPWAIRLLLSWIRRRLIETTKQGPGRLQPTPDFGRRDVEWFRTDAKAEAGRAWIGGWEVNGNQATENSRWFSMEVTAKQAPWVYAKANDPQRVIAALEMLATIVAIILFDPEKKRGGHSGCVLTGTTDNKGNSYIVKKLASTKWPLTTLLLELSEQLRMRKAILDLEWRRRDDNSEADALTNCDFKGFNPDLRVGATFDQIEWLVLPEIMGASQDLYKDVVRQREEIRQSKVKPIPVPKAKVQQRLKWKDPW